MALWNQNFESIKLSSGSTYTEGDLGNGLTASTVHQIFCVSAGTITLAAKGGGESFTWGSTPGQTIDMVVGSCIVDSGEFIGFKICRSNGSGPYRYKA